MSSTISIRIPVTPTPSLLPPSLTMAPGASQGAIQSSLGAAQSSAGAAAAFFSGALDGGLSPEEVMAACRHRLQNLDGQIREITSEMSRRNRLQEALGRVSRLAGQVTGSGENARLSEQAEEAIRQLQDEVESCGPQGVEAWAEIREQINATQDGNLTREEASELAETVSSLMSDLNAGSEMLQLRLQTLMNQRQQAVQLATNMNASLQQTVMAIIQNTGR